MRRPPGSSPCNCRLRIQLSCSAPVVVTDGPAQRTQAAPLGSGRNDHATTCSPSGVRRVSRTVAPSQLSASGTTAVSWIEARSRSHCAITVFSRSVCSSRAWLALRVRTMPSTPCQAIPAMIAITTIATSTSTSVKPHRPARDDRHGSGGRWFICAAPSRG